MKKKQTITTKRNLSALWVFCPIKYLSKLGSSEKQTSSDPTCYSHHSHQIKNLHLHKCIFFIFQIFNILAQWPGSVSNNVKTEKFKGFICCGFKASFVITTLHWHWTKWNIILCVLNVKTFVLSIFYHCLTMHVLISPKNESCNNGYDINVGCIKEKLNHFSAVWTPSHEST